MTTEIAPTSRVELETLHPCLNCGAPWRIVWRPVEDMTGWVAWQPSPGTCSAHCWSQDFEGFDAALSRRIELGWFPIGAAGQPA